MGEDRQQVRRERTRRSRRRDNEQATQDPNNGQVYSEAQAQLAEIDDIISDIVSPSAGNPGVVMGGQEAQNVRPLTSEELVSNFRQQGGQ